jgi:hypothetical protein
MLLIECSKLGVGGFLAQRTEVDPQLVRRLARPLIRLDLSNTANPQVENVERFRRVQIDLTN